jgi:hypothetical protein
MGFSQSRSVLKQNFLLGLLGDGSMKIKQKKTEIAASVCEERRS